MILGQKGNILMNINRTLGDCKFFLTWFCEIIDTPWLI